MSLVRTGVTSVVILNYILNCIIVSQRNICLFFARKFLPIIYVTSMSTLVIYFANVLIHKTVMAAEGSTFSEAAKNKIQY